MPRRTHEPIDRLRVNGCLFSADSLLNFSVCCVPLWLIHPLFSFQ